MKKKSFISKYWLKYTDRVSYKKYKWELANYKTAQFTNFLTSFNQLNTPARIKELADTNHQINFNHSGNAGDIIYALPTIKKIAETTKVPTNLYLRPNQPLKISADKTHPLGNVMLNEKSIEMLEPLISSQPYIDQYGALTNQLIDIDLDYFRAGLVPQDKGNIAHWCAYITGVNPVLWQKWLTVEPDLSFKNDVVIARSERYRNILINHKFLRNYDRLKFIGVESEFKDIRKYIPNIEWVQVSDFLQMAQIIAGCKFFIGNQSFPFSIAEALKVPRILEVSLEVINVIPEGENGYDFLFQDHFEALVKELYYQ
ncbi:MAG: hypothetical protein JWR38_1338 [Mucilaginibacter sp.]|nr:hypothetical protein [Mucilaginibacter sp.]